MRVRAISVAFIWLLACGTAGAVECTLQIFQSVEFTTCRVALRRESLQLYWRDEAGKPFGRLLHLRDSLASHGRKLAFGMNAGMYETDLSPLGLFIVDGRELRPLNRRTGSGNFYQPPNGVFLIDQTGARVITTEEYANGATPARLATQSGPMLVLRGAITDSPVMDAKSTSRKIRNGVCAPSSDAAVFVISNAPLTFYLFAKFFIDELGCHEALYLDGSISSLYAPQVGREDDGRDLGPIFGVAQ